MKTIGLIGGMSWESSIEYYRMTNEMVKTRLGGLHSCKSLMVSVDFAEIEQLQHRGDWDGLARLMIAAAQSLERGGADFVVICTNTMHKLADRIQAQIGIPLLHIADATAREIRQAGVTKVGLLGTRFTMEEDFYRKRLEEQHGIAVIVPEPAERETIHRIIYTELVVGQIQSNSRNAFQAIISRLVAAGAAGIVLGCTEIPLLVKPGDVAVRLFDTTAIHARAAVDLALEP